MKAQRILSQLHPTTSSTEEVCGGPRLPSERCETMDFESEMKGTTRDVDAVSNSTMVVTDHGDNLNSKFKSTVTHGGASSPQLPKPKSNANHIGASSLQFHKRDKCFGNSREDGYNLNPGKVEPAAEQHGKKSLSLCETSAPSSFKGRSPHSLIFNLVPLQVLKELLKGGKISLTYRQFHKEISQWVHKDISRSFWRAMDSDSLRPAVIREFDKHCALTRELIKKQNEFSRRNSRANKYAETLQSSDILDYCASLGCAISFITHVNRGDYLAALTQVLCAINMSKDKSDTASRMYHTLLALQEEISEYFGGLGEDLVETKSESFSEGPRCPNFPCMTPCALCDRDFSDHELGCECTSCVTPQANPPFKPRNSPNVSNMNFFDKIKNSAVFKSAQSIFKFCATKEIMAQFFPDNVWIYEFFHSMNDTFSNSVSISEILKHVDTVLKAVHRALVTGDINKLFENRVTSIDDLYSLIVTSDSVMDAVGGVTTEHRILLSYQWLNMRDSLSPAEKQTSMRIAQFNEVSKRLEADRTRLSNRDGRDVPVCFVLFGIPGTGKTNLVSAMNQIVMQIVGDFRAKGDYVVPSIAKFWDCMIKCPTSVCFGELDGLLKKDPNSSNPYALISNLVDTLSFNTPQAAIENKDQSLISPAFVSICTNSDVWLSGQWSQDWTRLIRRLHHIWDVAWDKEKVYKFMKLNVDDPMPSSQQIHEYSVRTNQINHIGSLQIFHEMVATHTNQGNIAFFRKHPSDCTVIKGQLNFIKYFRETFKKQWEGNRAKRVAISPLPCSEGIPLSSHECGRPCSDQCDYELKLAECMNKTNMKLEAEKLAHVDMKQNEYDYTLANLLVKGVSALSVYMIATSLMSRLFGSPIFVIPKQDTKQAQLDLIFQVPNATRIASRNFAQNIFATYWPDILLFMFILMFNNIWLLMVTFTLYSLKPIYRLYLIEFFITYFKNFNDSIKDELYQFHIRYYKRLITEKYIRRINVKLLAAVSVVVGSALLYWRYRESKQTAGAIPDDLKSKVVNIPGRTDNTHFTGSYNRNNLPYYKSVDDKDFSQLCDLVDRRTRNVMITAGDGHGKDAKVLVLNRDCLLINTHVLEAFKRIALVSFSPQEDFSDIFDPKVVKVGKDLSIIISRGSFPSADIDLVKYFTFDVPVKGEVFVAQVGIIPYEKVWKTVEGEKGYNLMYDHESVAGDCGRGAVIQTSVGPRIIGIHYAIDNWYSKGLINFVPRDKIMRFAVDDVQMAVTDHNIKSTLNFKSPLQWINNENVGIQLLGTSGPRLASTTTFEKTVLYDIVYPMLTSAVVIPSFKNGVAIEGKWVSPVTHKFKGYLQRTIHTPLLEKAREDFWNVELRELPPQTGPFSHNDVLVGNELVNGMPFNTSAGPGIPGIKKKKDMFFEVAPNQYGLKTQVFQQVQRYIELASKGPMYLQFRWALKDEILSVEKEEVAKYRVFMVSTAAYNIALKMYAGPLVAYMFKFPLVFECFGNMNAGSNQWKTFHDHVFTYEHRLASDFSHMDTSHHSTLITAAAYDLEKFAIRYFGYSTDDGKVLRNLIISIVYQSVEFSGDSFLVYNGLSSGVFVTLFMNSLIVSYLYRYAFYGQYSDLNFREHVILGAVGDDAVGSTNLPEFTQVYIADFLHSAGYKMTSCHKNKKLEDFEENPIFLQRRFLLKGDYVFAPLKEDSILKPFCFQRSDSGVDSLARLGSLVENAQREYFLHGREKMSWFQTEVMPKFHLYGLSYRIFTYDELLAEYDSDTFRTWDASSPTAGEIRL